jgi:hypothetical protein
MRARALSLQDRLLGNGNGNGTTMGGRRPARGED